jgi:hypothetical protein
MIKSKYSKISQAFSAFSIIFLGLEEQTAVLILCSFKNFSISLTNGFRIDL